MDPAGWLLWSLGHSRVDLCSWLAWEDTLMSLHTGTHSPPLGGNPHVAMDSASLRSRNPGAAGLGP